MLFSKSGWDLREYLLTTTLPEISGVGMGEDGPLVVPTGHKSHANHLSTRPSPHRLLTSMYVWDYEMLRWTIRGFMSGHAPGHAPGAADADPVSNERVTISSPPHFITNLVSPFSDPQSIDDFASWTHYFPLRTAERVFHIMFPDTKGHKVKLNYASDQDENLFRHMTFGLDDPHQTNPDDEDFASYPPSLIIAIQPPWILAPRDLESFVDSRKFPSFDPDKPNSPFRSKDLLWAKLWDLCVKKACQWFIVSNYQGWVFGAFSSGWTRAWVTDIIKFDDVGSTVIETIIFWLASSLGIPGTFPIPEPTMSCGSDIRKRQSSPCPKFPEITAARIAPPTLQSSVDIPVLMLHSSAFVQFPEPVPNFELAPLLPPALHGAKRTPSQMSGTLSWNSQELQGLEYESPDDDELSDDTVSNGKRPVPIDFNGTNCKSKVVNWRNDPRMKACKQTHSVAPSERTGDSFVSHFHHYADGIEIGTWMLGNPNRAHADTYYH